MGILMWEGEGLKADGGGTYWYGKMGVLCGLCPVGVEITWEVRNYQVKSWNLFFRECDREGEDFGLGKGRQMQTVPRQPCNNYMTTLGWSKEKSKGRIAKKGKI